jgi:predicted signal transduction protein with EAL and GGDEF domain
MTIALAAALALALIVIARLVSAHRASLEHQRQSDPLTGLPNRAGFETIVEDRIASDISFSIVWLDLDGFRRVNEEHGHASGDLLLAQVGPRIQRCVRSGDTVARFGGAQFLVLLLGHESAPGITSRILNTVSASAGISRYPNDAETAAELLVLAETAMLKAKSKTPGQMVFYERSMSSGDFGGPEAAALIRSSLANDRLRLAYQPIVDAEGEIVRMEAQVRIDDPILGRVPPVEFIGVAEQTGMIHEVGAWILREACRQLREWEDHGLRTRLTLNVSPRQMNEGNFAAEFLKELADWHLATSSITVHITGAAHPNQQTHRLRSEGVLISSLQISREDTLFDEIRISEPFYPPDNRPELTVIARGIERSEQLDRARAAGCHLFQGYQIAPPLEPRDATEILRAGLLAGAEHRR